MNKRYDRIFRLMPLLFSIGIAGCLDQETTTVVKSNGTAQRRIVVASNMSPFPLPTDSSWDTTQTSSGKGADSVKLVFTKNFASFEDLMKEYEHSGDTAHFAVRVSLEKSFRWFYTYYEYRETYGKFTHDTLVPPDKYLTADEMARYTYGDTSTALTEKVEMWHNRNFYEILFGYLQRAASHIKDGGTSTAALNNHKEEFFHALFARENQMPEIVDKDGHIIQPALDSLSRFAGRVFKIPISPGLADAFGEGVKAELHHAIAPESKAGWSFTNSISLPGSVMQTNAPIIKGNTATWKLDVDRLAFMPLEMHAESRSVNLWAIVVTAALALVPLGWLVFRGRKPLPPSPSPAQEGAK